ncbi:ATP synthase subunit s, mitochondrial isoform X2 [Megalopta genalis]|uniref:ATP synthase subunit s, mitochondrial isoform X2 n=1 Tax=Megalopta genalis TaxID=115081 RepID=UPI003FCF0D3F
MTLYALGRLNSSVQHCTRHQHKSIFYWLTVAFNSVNEERRKQLGPDISCAEWLLRNGAFVKWKDSPEEITDYNALPTTYANYKIEVVNAIDAGISYVGFPHFEGCKHIKTIKLDNCRYINDKAISMLPILESSLTQVLLLNLKSITDDGLRELKNLKNLEEIDLQGLSYVENLEAVCAEIKAALPKSNAPYFSPQLKSTPKLIVSL